MLYCFNTIKCYNDGGSLTSCTLGSDHLCSDGKCYSKSGCPTGYTVLSSFNCTCGHNCSGTCSNTCTSSLQVFISFCICFKFLNYSIGNFFNFYSKCLTPTCNAGGPDQICSDGKCYPNATVCGLLGLTQFSSVSCTCAASCNACTAGVCTATSQSLLQVFNS